LPVKRFFISGRVQGVGYRFFAKHAASSLCLKGFVRNLSNEDVEIVAEGSQEQLDSFLEQLQIGPVLSKVIKVTSEEISLKEQFEKFEIRH